MRVRVYCCYLFILRVRAYCCCLLRVRFVFVFIFSGARTADYLFRFCTRCVYAVDCAVSLSCLIICICRVSIFERARRGCEESSGWLRSHGACAYVQAHTRATRVCAYVLRMSCGCMTPATLLCSTS